MGFYDSEENINKYIKLAEGFDGRELIQILKNYVSENSSVLELGTGPGVDLEILEKSYRVTGSDYSTCFVDRLRKQRPDADILALDARAMDTDKTFDCIYSNKVLVHFTSDEIKESLERQSHALNKQGILFHTFWKGEGTKRMGELFFNYLSEEELASLVGNQLEILEIKTYKEMDDEDSIYIVLRKI